MLVTPCLKAGDKDLLASQDALLPYTSVGGVEAWGAHQILAKMNPTLGKYSS